MSLDGTSVENLSQEIDHSQKLLEGLAVALEHLARTKNPLYLELDKTYVSKEELRFLAMEEPAKFQEARGRRQRYNNLLPIYQHVLFQHDELKRLETALSELIRDDVEKIQRINKREKVTADVNSRLNYFLTNLTNCEWENDPHSKTRVRSQPLTEEDAKELTRLLGLSEFDDCNAEYCKSPSNPYYRVFLNKKPTINILVADRMAHPLKEPLGRVFYDFEPYSFTRNKPQ